MNVLITNEQDKIQAGQDIEELVRSAVAASLEYMGVDRDAEISVLFTDNENIRELNREHRGIDRATDVLSFPMGENGEYDVNHDTGAKILGDIVISMEKAVEQASRYGHSLEREVGYLTAHSMLHLLGYDHEKSGLDRVRMREKEEQVMSQLGLPSTSSYVLGDE